MWSLALVALLVFVTKGDSEEIIEMTTIYDMEDICTQSNSTSGLTGRIHSQTDVLGLPLNDQKNHSLIDPKYAKSIHTCDWNNCSWDFNQWNLEYYTLKMRRGEAIVINTSVKIVFESIPYYSSMTKDNFLYLIFTPNPSLIRNIEGNISMVVFSKHSSGTSVYLTVQVNCHGPITQKYQHSYKYNVPDLDGIIAKVGCDDPTNLYAMSIRDELNVLSNDGAVQLKLRNSLLLSSQDFKYFSTVGLANDMFKLLIKYPRYTATAEGTEMVSSIIDPELSQLCIVLDLYSTTYVGGDLLHILAVDQINTEHFLQAVNNVKVGWNSIHVNITLQSDVLHPIKLVIRKKGSTEVTIRHISSCDQSANVTKMPDETKQCFNGDELISAGCACPPGFSGAQCQLGCESNHFGNDCEGMCSLHSQQCQGLLICTSVTGCPCHPGYKGNYCTERCLPGWYGNDCSLQCGHCVSGTTCNIFTGRCVSCDPGYVPPYCQQEYVYYALRPEVTSTKYGTLTVLFYPSNFTGHGTPKLYQVQYREQGTDWITYTSKNISVHKSNQESSIEELDFISETVDGLKDGVLYQVRVLLMDASLKGYTGDLVQISEAITKCDIPDSYDYNVTTITNTTSITFMWNYVNTTAHWCPVETYEVSWKEDRQWVTEHSQGSFSVTNLLPGATIQFQVRAKTSRGYAPYSATALVTTIYYGTYAVQDLHMVSAQPTSVEIAWRPPIDGNNRTLSYRITYKCVEQPACPPGCVNASKGELIQNETSLKINELLPFTQYNISVTPEDGVETTIKVGTIEIVSCAPEGLKLVNRSATTIGLQWNFPNFANDTIRSFFVSVEETDKFDQDNCCQVYPLIEIPVADEVEHYEAEVSGLQPASAYYVSVSAKTADFGPSQSLVVCTRPPYLPFTQLPPQAILSGVFHLSEPLTWIPQQLQPEVNKSELYTPLIKTRLLLAVISKSQPIQEVLYSGVIDQELDYLLKQVVSKQFFFVAEYNEEELVTDSEWGETPSPTPFTEGQRYQLVAAQITEYNGVYNADIRYSTTFTYQLYLT